MLKIVLSLILLLNSCDTTLPRQYTFPIEGKGYGFVAEYKEWTATHIALEDFSYEMNDTFILGDSEVYGLEICDNKHISGNWAYYYSNFTGKVTIILGVEYLNSWDVFVDKTITRGDSGTPVLCYKHDAVIGLVSAVYISSPQVGIISNVP